MPQARAVRRSSRQRRCRRVLAFVSVGALSVPVGAVVEPVEAAPVALVSADAGRSPVAVTLRAGEGRVLVDGSRVPSRVRLDTASVWDLQTRGGDDWGGFLNVGGEGVWTGGEKIPAVYADRGAGKPRYYISAAGAPRTGYSVFLVRGRESVRLTSGSADTAGNGPDGRFPIPRGTRPGPWAVQWVGTDDAGRSVVASLGVRVLAPGVVPQVAPGFTQNRPWALRQPGYTRLTRLPLRTNAGRPTQVRVRCRPADPVAGEKESCRAVRSSDALGVRLSAGWAGTVSVHLRAPRVPGYTAFTRTERYAVPAVG